MSGGSFGASPLAQHIGLGKATKIASMEIVWPGSGTRQIFRNVDVNQFCEIMELDTSIMRRQGAKVPLRTEPTSTHHAM